MTKTMKIIQNALNLTQSKPYGENVKTQLREYVRKSRDFNRAYRNGAFDYLDAYPCGYQDAWGDKVAQFHDEFEALKLARALEIGNHRIVARYFNRALSDY